MTRAISSTLSDPFRSEAPEPLWLLDLATGLASPANVRLCNFDGGVTFNSLAFTARGFEVGRIAHEGQSEAGGVQVRIQDTDGWWQSNLASAELWGKRAKLYRLDRDVVAGAHTSADAIRDDFYVEGVDRLHGWIVLRLRSLFGLFSTLVPRGTITRKEFPGIPETAALAR